MMKTIPTLFAKVAATLCAGALCLGIPAVAQNNPANAPAEAERPLGVWPRNDWAYLTAAQPMPLWVQLPPAANVPPEDLTLSLALPAGFKITSWGKSKEFAVQPKPLVVPAAIREVSSDANGARYECDIPAAEVPKGETSGRLSLMVSPGTNPAGEYAARFSLARKGAPVGAERTITLKVLPPLKGKRPRRLQVGAYNYNGLTDVGFLRDLDQVVLNSGINFLWDMRGLRNDDTPEARANSLTSRLAPSGVRGGVLWFWSRFATDLQKSFPEGVRVDAQGKPVPAEGVAASWVLANRDKVAPLVEADLRAILATGLYQGVILDHEERALSRDGKAAVGDVYNPGAMEAFARFAKLDKAPPADPAYIAEHHADAWVDYRCWQSAQLSAMVADIVAKIDPTLSYGLYSGYEYAPPLEGLTRRSYSVDWKQMATEGKVQFGAAGYYGKADDIQATARALGNAPFMPADMFTEHFLRKGNTLLEPDQFAFRLLTSFLASGGQGGLHIWYLSVLDAGAYEGIARVSRVLADLEPFFLQGERAEALLNVPRDIDPNDVYVYRLDGQYAVLVLNRSATRPMNFRAGWTNAVIPKTSQNLTSGSVVANASVLEAELQPRSYAVFLTVADGN